MSEYVYRCPYMAGDTADWTTTPVIGLVDTFSGELPRLGTGVQICRTDRHVHFRFECEDDHVVATYTDRDDPIYKEDAVEIFVDPDGNGRHYMEFELSPRNVIFDALIDKEEGCRPIVNAGWNMEGLLTRVTWPDRKFAVYELSLPVTSLSSPPVPGAVWRINFYRIDNDADGGRHYWAWSPTGERRNFHVPAKFGTLRFD